MGVFVHTVKQYTRIAQGLQKTGSHLKIRGIRKATSNEFHTEAAQVLGETVQNLDAQVSGLPTFAYPCSRPFIYRSPDLCPVFRMSDYFRGYIYSF
jgi:hypothetical protein